MHSAAARVPWGIATPSPTKVDTSLSRSSIRSAYSDVTLPAVSSTLPAWRIASSRDAETSPSEIDESGRSLSTSSIVSATQRPYQRSRSPKTTAARTAGNVAQRTGSVRGLVPVLAGTDLHIEWHPEVGGVSHPVPDDGGERIELTRCYLENQLIVHLHEHVGL